MNVTKLRFSIAVLAVPSYGTSPAGMFALPSITNTPLIHALKPSSYCASKISRSNADTFVALKVFRRKTDVYAPFMSPSVVTIKVSP